MVVAVVVIAGTGAAEVALATTAATIGAILVNAGAFDVVETDRLESDELLGEIELTASVVVGPIVCMTRF